MLTDKKILITGASLGLGRRTACAFAENGAKMVICSRNAQRLAEARDKIAEYLTGNASVQAVPADVSDPDHVEKLVATAVETLGGLDVLFANAGIYGPKGPVETNDMDEWVQALKINLLGMVYCCRAVAPILKQQRSGKVLVAGGGGATKPMPNFSAYAASKAGVARFAETFAAEVVDFGVTVNVVAPGALDTQMLDEVLEAGPEKAGQAFYDACRKVKARGGDSIDRAAALCVFLASTMSDGITGKIISAKWDPWETLPDHVQELQSDIYTLRRIIPSERGKTWGEVDA